MENTEFVGLDDHFRPTILDNWQDCGKNQNVTRLVTASNNSISSFVGKLCDLELQCQGWTWRIEASIERSGCRLQETLSSPWPRANLIRYANYFFFVVLLCKACSNSLVFGMYKRKCW